MLLCPAARPLVSGYIPVLSHSLSGLLPIQSFFSSLHPAPSPDFLAPSCSFCLSSSFPAASSCTSGPVPCPAFALAVSLVCFLSLVFGLYFPAPLPAPRSAQTPRRTAPAAVLCSRDSAGGSSVATARPAYRGRDRRLGPRAAAGQLRSAGAAGEIGRAHV